MDSWLWASSSRTAVTTSAGDTPGGGAEGGAGEGDSMALLTWWGGCEE